MINHKTKKINIVTITPELKGRICPELKGNPELKGKLNIIIITPE